MPRQSLSRTKLLAVGGVALLGGVARPAAAVTPSDNDLAYLRLLVGAELLAADVQAKALASRRLVRRSRAVLAKMAADDKAHHTRLAQLVAASGQTPAAAGDIDFSYPKGSFASPAAVLSLAARIEALVLGAYLGAVENVEAPDVRVALGQIAANEAQHASALALLRGRAVIGTAFAPVLQIDAASAALDRYES